MYFIRPYQDYSFRCWCSNNSVRPFSLRCLCKLIGGRRCCFLLRSFDSIILSLPEALWCSSPHSSFRIVRPCSFRAYPFNRGVVPAFQVLPILSSFASLLNRSAVCNVSYPLCHSFNSSGGNVLLISSSILSSCSNLCSILLFKDAL